MAPSENKHIDPNDLTVMDGAIRAVETFLATENARDAHLKLRVGFELVPPAGRDYDFKTSSNLAIDVLAVRNLPRARPEVLKKHEEDKKNRLDAIRREKQAKSPSSTKSVTSSTSHNSISDRAPAVRQPAGGDDFQSSSSATTPTVPF